MIPCVTDSISMEQGTFLMALDSIPNLSCDLFESRGLWLVWDHNILGQMDLKKSGLGGYLAKGIE